MTDSPSGSPNPSVPDGATPNPSTPDAATPDAPDDATPPTRTRPGRTPGTSAAPTPAFAIGTPDAVGARLGRALGLDEPLPAHDAQGTVCVDVPRERWHDTLALARAEGGLDMIDWLSAVDEPDAEPAGLDVVAHLVDSRSGGRRPDGSAPGLVRLIARTRLPADDLAVASVTDLWPGAAWNERETHEMFGVRFDGFDDGSGQGLRPLLLPDGFEGTPLRKSFVLASRASKPWPGAKEPGESDAGPPSRRKVLPPGVPDPSWGPRQPSPREAGA
jgi:NADH-quinone oxidoreductase subunit C